MEQLVARWAHNPKVAGSSPAPATRKESHYRKMVAFLRYKALLTIDIRYSALRQEHPVFGKIPQTNYLAPKERPATSGNSDGVKTFTEIDNFYKQDAPTER